MGVEDYHELIGEGSFGRVYKGRRKYTGHFIMTQGKSEKDIQSIRQEIEILLKLKRGNIIEMLDSFENERELCVVTEFAQLCLIGELFEILEDDKHLPEEQVQAIAKQLLCDFGFVRAMSTNTVVFRSIKGTPLYMAPELVREQPYNHTSDLWSLGVILYELYVGQPPFYTNSVYALIRHIVKVSESRLTWPALLEHPFIKDSLEEVEARDASTPGVVAAAQSDMKSAVKVNYPSPEDFLGFPTHEFDKNQKRIDNKTGACNEIDCGRAQDSRWLSLGFTVAELKVAAMEFQRMDELGIQRPFHRLENP
ncbi:unnamed protein product [Brassica napus]|uniref:non-specific serine/threonine protein kinase n=2 Tax=Brassica napus TaxID=3708 RepID=A0A816TKI6_BRANA|nr:unnamed protein product [Brassica napus]